MKKRKFTFEDQKHFAMLSGDYNPLHLNEIAARRFLFGQPVVYGVFVLLWALESWLKDEQISIELRSLRAIFHKPIPIDQEVNCSFSPQTAGGVKIVASVNDVVVATITATWIIADKKKVQKLPDKNPDCNQCKVLTMDTAMNTSGVFDLCISRKQVLKLFPHLIKKMRLMQIAEILATTRMVGMECPGYHSIFSALDVSFETVYEGPLRLHYEVYECDARFSLLNIKVKGPSIHGIVKAFFRPLPTQYESYTNLRNRICEKEFEQQNALIIGGSRGLGEIAAKLLAAGGAKVKITFYKGEEDARQIIKEICLNGGSADCIPFDVLNIKQNEVAKLVDKITPTHLYYFATPFIFSKDRYGSDNRSISSELFERFSSYYITAFATLVDDLLKVNPWMKKIFYPSSVAVNERLLSLAEYAVAKAGAETLCSLLEKRYQDLFIYRPRLPRMATDQTASLLLYNNQDPVPIILNHLRIFRDSI